MPRMPKPFFRKPRKLWYVQIGRVQHNLGPDREAAFQRYHELMRAAGREQVPCSLAEPTVYVVLDQFLQWSKRDQPAATFNWYHRFLVDFAATIPAHLRVSDLRPIHVTDWLAKHDWSDSTRYGAVSAVKRAIRWGRLQRLHESNPLEALERPAPQCRSVVLTPEHLSEALTIVDEHCRRLLIVMASTGCRPQEARAIEARHVDLSAGTITFPATQAKGKRRPRVIVLTQEATDVLAPLMAKHPTGPLLRSVTGRPWSARMLRRWFERIGKRLGMRAVAYGVRHGYGSQAMADGVDSVVLAHLMGHTSTKMIEKHYGHLDRQTAAMRREAERASLLKRKSG